MFTTNRVLRFAGVAASVTLVTALAACSGAPASSSSAPGSASAPASSAAAALTDIAVWDPYPQHDANSDWAKYVQSCAPAGTTVKRTSSATSDLLNSLTTAVKEDNAPDVVMLDNPAVPDAASAGLLAPATDVGMDNRRLRCEPGRPPAPWTALPTASRSAPTPSACTTTPTS